MYIIKNIYYTKYFQEKRGRITKVLFYSLEGIVVVFPSLTAL